MTTQLCFNQSEAIELHGPHGLYLKPIAKLNISVTLPQMKMEGKSISNWEVMEKLKRMAKPDSFLVLRVSKSSLEFLRFEAEVEARSLIKVLITRLDAKVIKLSGFPEALKVRAAEAKVNFPNRHDWDSFFRDAKNMNENNPGERPDTIKIESLPCKWFSSTAEPDKPSELIMKKVFESFGEVRNVDIPMLDPYRHESQVIGGNFRTFSSFNTLIYEAYVQYTEYIGFVKAMDALKGMKLMKKEPITSTDEDGKEGKAYTADIKVDFDKTRHMSAKAIRKREKERQRLIQLEEQREEQKRLEREEEERKQEEERRRKEQEELYKTQRKQAKLTRREERRQQREEKRRQLREEKKRQRQEQELQHRIALEERKLLIALRQLESIRLLTELFERVKVIKQHEEVQRRLEELEQERLRQLEEERQKKEREEHLKEKEVARKMREMKRREARLKRKLTENLKSREEQEEERRREDLRQKLSGRSRLKSAVVTSKYPRPHIDDYDYEYGDRKEKKLKKPKLKSAVAYKHR